jgi:hypothetical protein
VGEAAGCTALGGHDVDLGIAVVLPGEGEVASVGGEAGEHLVTVGVGGEAAGDAAGSGGEVEIAGVGERDAAPMDGGETEETRFGGGRGERNGEEGQSEAEAGDGAHAHGGSVRTRRERKRKKFVSRFVGERGLH